MVGIGGVGYVAPLRRAVPVAKGGTAGFLVSAGRAEGAVATAAVTMPGLLDLQEAESTAVGDREARRQAENMLDALKELQRELLGGNAAPALERAAELAKRSREAADPKLRDVQKAVLLRVAVERARYVCDIEETGR